MPVPPTEWVSSALQLTGHFEDSDAPWSAVSGNFDGMGVSLGVLQWNLGQGSLQPLVQRAGEAVVRATMPSIGEDFWIACHATSTQWREIVATWHVGTTLKPTAFTELRAFTGCAAFVEQQIVASSATASTAHTYARDWAASDPAFKVVTKALFCWFFDLTTQNGNLKGISIANLGAFRASHSDPRGFVCDWLAGQPSSVAGAKDAHLNAQLWRGDCDAQRESLFLLSYLRCLKSNPLWQVDTLNRKGTIARWFGWVHRDQHELTNLLTG